MSYIPHGYTIRGTRCFFGSAQATVNKSADIAFSCFVCKIQYTFQPILHVSTSDNATYYETVFGPKTIHSTGMARLFQLPPCAPNGTNHNSIVEHNSNKIIPWTRDNLLRKQTGYAMESPVRPCVLNMPAIVICIRLRSQQNR